MAQKGADDIAKPVQDEAQQSPASRQSFFASPVRQAPFAGRIGGNQEFVAIGDDERSRELLKKQPDAAPIFKFRDALDPQGFLVVDTWRQGVIEGWGTCLQVFVFGAMGSGLTAAGQSLFASALYAALGNTVGLSLFIFAAAPMTGGHLNPTISIATCLAGLATIPRAILYIAAQSTGAIVGAYWLKLGLGDSYFSEGVIPGCTVEAGLVSPGELFALEFMFAQALIFMAFGVGLDPRQAKVFGPAFAPILVGMTLGLGTLASSLAKPGYIGLSFNPARCLGLMTAKGYWQYHYVHWLAPISAAIVNAFFYHFFPPYVRNRPLAVHNPINASA